MDPHFDGVIFKTYPQELERRMQHPYPPFFVIDVRPDADRRATGVIAGTVALLPEELGETLPAGTDAATEFIVYGSDQYDPAVRDMAQALRRLGAHRVVELAGGIFEWVAEGRPLVTAQQAA